MPRVDWHDRRAHHDVGDLRADEGSEGDSVVAELLLIYAGSRMMPKCRTEPETPGSSFTGDHVFIPSELSE